MTVTVVMSAYNGQKNIERQIESIFAQKDVTVNLSIRDDGSTDRTVEVIEEYQRKHPEYNISLLKGNNVGYAKSFWYALSNAIKAEYYAFSDQDDIWKEDKLIKCISVLEREKNIMLPQLVYCRMSRCNEQLEELEEQVRILCVEELSKKMTLTQTYNYGAGTFFNEALRKLICKCWPDVPDMAHDLWAGLLCYWFGRVYYIDEVLYYWIRYDKSVTGEGTLESGFRYRMKKTFQGHSYPNVSSYLLKYYGDLLEEDKLFLTDLSVCSKDWKAKLRILKDKEFKRSTYKGTLVLKFGVLLGWF